MKKEIVFGSVCSGIEAASMAWKPLGWKAAWYSEIEPFPSAVLAEKHPEAPNLGDMTTLKERLSKNGKAINVLVGGTPCQSFSVAGLRKGLADPRGNLALVFLGLLDALRPKWVVWENVPGVLSSSEGRDFGAFLGGLAELGYGWAYRVLDAQYFGVPQRRRRVFVVGCLGDQRRAAAVLFERACLSGDPAPSREARKVTPTLSSSGTGVSRPGFNSEDEWFVTHPLTASYDASEDGCGRGTPIIPDVAGCLQERDSKGPDSDTKPGHLIPIVIDRAAFNQGKNASYEPSIEKTETMPSIVARGPHAVAFDTTQVTNPENRSNPKPGDPCHSLAAKAHPPCLLTMRDGCEGGGKGPLIQKDRSGALATGNNQVLFQPGGVEGEEPMAIQDVREGVETKKQNGKGYNGDGTAYTLDAQATMGVQLGMQVRRLTPRECERLMGFPDDYTLVRYRGGYSADGPRYKALGNSMAVPVIKWIGERIMLVEGVK